MSIWSVLRAIVVGCAALASGCGGESQSLQLAIEHTPTDVELFALRAVQRSTQPELLDPDAGPLVGLAPNGLLGDINPANSEGTMPDRLLLRLEFTSSIDLFEYVHRNDFNLWGKAYFCAPPGEQVLMTFSDVYRDGQRIGPYSDSPPENHFVPGLFKYYFYINVSHKGSNSSLPKNRYHSFDLLKSPQDVCFDLRGGNTLGMGYKSNVVLIPKLDIEEALNRVDSGARFDYGDSAPN